MVTGIHAHFQSLYPRRVAISCDTWRDTVLQSLQLTDSNKHLAVSDITWEDIVSGPGLRGSRSIFA
jgi:hypothetical protein